MPTRSIARTWILGVLVTLVTVSACEREPAPQQPLPPDTGDTVPVPQRKPSYTFAEGLRTEHPEVSEFMQSFLEVCLAGDYTAYRKLVSRLADPESKARFERMLHALDAVTILAIEPIELRELPPPTYLVTVAVELRKGAQSPPRQRRLEAGVAMLVFREEGAWCMMVAPPALQPQPPAPDEPTTQPTTTSAPSYDAWDDDVDY
jgi:hypothetical protein